MKNLINCFEISPPDFRITIGFCKETLEIDIEDTRTMGSKMELFAMSFDTQGNKLSLPYSN